MRKLLILALLVAMASLGVLAQGLQTLNIDQAMRIDATGDGAMTIKFTLTAEQFQKWQMKFGQNQAFLRREMQKFVSQYETRDWEVQEKQMDRTETIALKILGAVIHKGGGLFEFRVPKQWRGGERTGSTFAYNYVESMGPGAVTQTNVKLILPESASRFTEEKAETGDRIIQYTLPTAGYRAMAPWLGLLLLIPGMALAAIGLFAMRGPASSR